MRQLLSRFITIPAALWGLSGGLLAGLCCIGPAAAALLGLGAASALAAFQVDRALAFGLGAALLLCGAALQLRRRTCSPAGDARRVWLVLLPAFGLSWLFFGYGVPAFAAQRIAAETRPVQAQSAPAHYRTVLSIEKMDCPPCAAKVRSILSEHPAVNAFSADDGGDAVVIDYHADQPAGAAFAQLFPISYGVSLLSDSALP